MRALNVRIQKDADRDVDLTHTIFFANVDRHHPYIFHRDLSKVINFRFEINFSFAFINGYSSHRASHVYGDGAATLCGGVPHYSLFSGCLQEVNRKQSFVFLL